MDYYNLSLYLVGTFLGLNLIVGLLAGRKATTMREYALANKVYGTGPLVMTYVATFLGGAWIFIRPKEIFEFGIGSVYVIFFWSITMFIQARYLAPRMLPFRNCLSLGDMIGQLYGKQSKIFAGVLSFIFGSIIAGMNISFLGMVFEKFLGLNGTLGIVLGGVVISLYACLGGMKAVTATDIFQFILLSGALILLAVLCIDKVGGLESLLTQIPKERFNFWDNQKIYYYLSLILSNLIFSSVLVGPTNMDRALMAKSPYHLSKMFNISGFAWIMFIIIIAIISFSALVLYPDLDSSDLILHVTNSLCPEWLKGFVVIGIIAILFSTADSYIHSAGVSFSRNIINPLKYNDKPNANEIRWAKFGTAIAGLMSMWLAIWGKHMFRPDIWLSIIAPSLAAPLLLGIIGLKPEKKAFWASVMAAIATLLICRSANPIEYPVISGLSLFWGCCASAITYMVVHINIHQGICIEKHNGYNDPDAKVWKPNLEKLVVKIKNLLILPFQFASRCNQNIAKYGTPPYELFGGLYIAILILPYFIWHHEPGQFDNIMLYLRMLGVLTCSLLMTVSVWPEKVRKKYLAPFWYITLTYCLPFVSTILLLFTNGAVEYTVCMAVTAMLLIILTDWVSAITMAIIGISLANYLYNYSIIPNYNEVQHLDFHTTYMLSYQVILAIAIGLLFIKKKHKVVDLNKSMNTRLKNLNLEQSRRLNEVLQLDKAAADSLGMKEINMIERVANLKILCENFMNSVPNKKDFEQKYSEGITTLKYLESVADHSRDYLKLNVKKINLDLLLGAINESATLYNNSYSILARTEITELEADYMALLNGVILEVLEQVEFYKAESDHVTIDVADTEIMYKLPSLPSYDKRVEALQFTISKAL
jgi:Na+/proline symporter